MIIMVERERERERDTEGGRNELSPLKSIAAEHEMNLLQRLGTEYLSQCRHMDAPLQLNIEYRDTRWSRK